MPQQCPLQHKLSLYFHTAAVVSLQQEPFLYFHTAAAVSTPAQAFSVFPHCRSSVAPAQAFSVFPHCRSSVAPAGAFSLLPHCRSSVYSSTSVLRISTLPQQCPLPQEPLLYFHIAAAVSTGHKLSPYFHTAAAVSAPTGAFSVFPPCRSSICSRRSLFCISTLPQQCPLPQEPLLYFHTAAVVSLQQEPFLYFHTATAVSTPAQAFSVFLHCRSSVRSHRSLFSTSTLPQQCLQGTSFLSISTLPQQYLLPQKPLLYFHTAAAVSAPAGASSVFPHCRSSICSRRSLFCISTLPQ
ncbi:hypothetical protein ROHU_006838 [Labeo rohita]|uniref:Uncharacterized protein n=1 Tax=Labeo rohita TaxID=84645 RepID=A0A498MLG8_LABRO|nr:hypothetical protein ROHU_006838 [Labeo rohita]